MKNFIERTDTVNAIFRTANASEIISESEENFLIKVYKDKRSTEEEKKTVKDKLILGNLRYIISLVKSHTGVGESFDDLFQESILGIDDALNKFDLSQGVRFWTYAKDYIHQRITLYRTRTAPLVVPSNYTMQPRIRKARAKFIQEHEREPNEDELINLISEMYGVQIKNRSDLYGTNVSYMQETYDGDNSREIDDERVNAITASQNAFEEASEREEISDSTRKAMLTLSARERRILCLAYGIGVDRQYKDYEISEQLGFTSERIRQIRTKAQDKMRNVLSTAKA